MLHDVAHDTHDGVVALLQQVDESLRVALLGAQEAQCLAVAALFLHGGQHVRVVGVEAKVRQVAVVEEEAQLAVVLGEHDVGRDVCRRVVVLAVRAKRLGVEAAYDVCCSVEFLAVDAHGFADAGVAMVGEVVEVVADNGCRCGEGVGGAFVLLQAFKL